jgi:hypothetical protein
VITARSLADILHKEAAVDDGLLPSTEPERLVHLVGVMALHEAVQAAGWTEHTNDWDWFLWVTLTDGTEIEADGWGIVDMDEPDKVLELNFVKGSHDKKPKGLYLEWTRGETHKRVVPLGQVVKIHVEEAH